ncbi:hypothetical protein GI584_16090 [Gracilibacillus salitolerans]|uniref:Uncharacterized protein n=1 Tax=Gracilibacillus salitolerans TaxID=2663022 RepID=A0A5Q2TL40_9BACI|nr:hypothetical protein [Gracilibacillus salitolerans]QGH35476.1 hypothetical protein GI584_16090 [Gracilibacillus salitolerans]
MKQEKYSLILFIFLILPSVAHLLESIMIFHMHTQMPLFVFAGFLMTPFFKKKFPNFFMKWNRSGIPGILLVILVWSYWQIPRAMDDALTHSYVEIFKFISLPFLVGIPLRDSWQKIRNNGQFIFLVYLLATLIVTGFLYIWVDEQICNNYLIIEQQTLGWGSLAMAACLLLYLFYRQFERDEGV